MELIIHVHISTMALFVYTNEICFSVLILQPATCQTLVGSSSLLVETFGFPRDIELLERHFIKLKQWRQWWHKDKYYSMKQSSTNTLCEVNWKGKFFFSTNEIGSLGFPHVSKIKKIDTSAYYKTIRKINLK